MGVTPQHKEARIAVGKTIVDLFGDGGGLISGAHNISIEFVELLAANGQGPMGGTSTQVLVVVELEDGSLRPVMMNIYCDNQIDQQFNALVKQRAIDQERDNATRAAMSFLKGETDLFGKPLKQAVGAYTGFGVEETQGVTPATEARERRIDEQLGDAAARHEGDVYEPDSPVVGQPDDPGHGFDLDPDEEPF